MGKSKLLFIPLVFCVLVIGGGIALLTVGRGAGQFFFGRKFAESELGDYVSTVLKQEVNGAHCQSRDTNGNGYVSCDYTLVSQPTIVHSIDCAAWGINGFLNRGCKVRLPNFPK